MRKKKVPVNYTSRDFESIKEELVRHAKRYYPDAYQDFNEAGFGSLLFDTVAYVGDMLSFYLDYQANESFLDTANEQENIIRLAKQLGYKYDNSASSTGYASFYIYVPSLSDGSGPDSRYVPILRKNSTFSSANGTQFILESDLVFDSSTSEIAIGRTDENTGLPTYFAVKAYGKVSSGKYNTANVSVGQYKKFLKLQVPLQNVVEIISVRDQNGFDYYEVENLAQDIVYKSIVNRNSANDKVDNLIRPLYVPRRFVVDKNGRDTFLQFGSGKDETDSNKEAIVDPSSVVLKFNAKEYISDLSFDPNKLLETNKMGIVPSETTLSITARVNTNTDVNISANSLNIINDARIEFNNEAELDQDVIGFIKNSLEVNNENPILGYVSNINSQDLKKMAYSTFSSQGRAVTQEDYRSLLYRMPKKFGSIKRANVIRDAHSYKRNLNIYIISENNLSQLQQAPTALKENAKIWLTENKMINDVVDIIDAKIVNFSIRFQITNDDRFPKEQTLASCLNSLKEFYKIKPNIGEPFSISDVYRTLRNVEGVLDVISVVIVNKNGGNYSPVSFDVAMPKSSDNRYIDIPQNAVWEIKFPNSDSQGVVV